MADRINWPLFEQHGSLVAIEHHLEAHRKELERQEATVARLIALRNKRAWQIERGEWPSAFGAGKPVRKEAS